MKKIILLTIASAAALCSCSEKHHTDWNQFKNPENLTLAVEKDGSRYYLTQTEYQQMTPEAIDSLSPVGLVIDYEGRKYLLDLYEQDGKYTWEEAMEIYGPQLPTQEQAESWVAQIDSVYKAVNTFGGHMPGPGARDHGDVMYWTSTNTSTMLYQGSAYVVDITRNTGHSNDGGYHKSVRLVKPL